MPPCPSLVRLTAGRAAELAAVASQGRPLADNSARAQHRILIHPFPFLFRLFCNDTMRKL